MAVIEVFADVACPFAHAGLRAVVAQRHELGRDDVLIRVRAWPLELVNGAPLRPQLIDEEVADLRAQVAPELFEGFEVAHFPQSSLPALALAATAYRMGDHIGEQVSLALRDALFEEGQDISDPAVLGRIQADHGLGRPTTQDRDTIESDWEAGKARDVKGSPHFFCADASAFCPSLDVSKDAAGHLRVHADPAALRKFLSGCLAL